MTFIYTSLLAWVKPQITLNYNRKLSVLAVWGELTALRGLIRGARRRACLLIADGGSIFVGAMFALIASSLSFPRKISRRHPGTQT
jgi:hypothetical protein